MPTVVRPVPPSALRSFLATEAAGGILLMAAAALAMIVANSPLYSIYHEALHAPIGPVLTNKLGPMSPSHCSRARTKMCVIEYPHQNAWRELCALCFMRDVVRRIGGQNSHPGLHRVLASWAATSWHSGRLQG